MVIEDDQQRALLGSRRRRVCARSSRGGWRMTIAQGDAWGSSTTSRNDPHEMDNLFEIPAIACACRADGEARLREMELATAAAAGRPCLMGRGQKGGRGGTKTGAPHFPAWRWRRLCV